MRSIQPVHPLVDFHANKLRQGRMAKDHGVTRLGTLSLALGLDNCFYLPGQLRRCQSRQTGSYNPQSCSNISKIR